MKIRPALRYFGGKWLLAPWIIQNLPPHRVYVEPFAGAASVLLRKPRAYAEVYNDLDGEVVNVFQCMRDPALATQLERLLELTPFSRTEFRGAYESSPDPVEQARRTIIRSFMGFGSGAGLRASATATGFRSCSNRSGTTPAHDWSHWPQALPFFTERLRGVVIESRDAFELIPQHDGPDTLFYVDPPYLPDTRSSFQRDQYRHEMDDTSHERLGAALKGVEGMVVISGYPHALYETIYQGWHRIERDALADGARKRTEVLWMNAAASARMPRQELESFA